MNALARGLQHAATCLSEFDVPWALVGGLAISTRCEPRFTRDIDLAVAVEDDSAAEDLVFRFSQRGYTIDMIIEQDRAGRIATARLRGEGSSLPAVVVDLLFASSGIESEIIAAAVPLEVLSGLQVPVASVGHLIAMKLLSADRDRPKDEQDIQSLLAVADDRDRDVARQATRLIQDRGYGRGRDLAEALELHLHR